MNKIEVKILNVDAVKDAEQMLVAMARLTQRGADISSMEDLERLIDRDYSDKLVSTLSALPHPTLQKFGIINIAIVGASRRFLAQITRHQNEVKFMSGSLQYSDYTDKAKFCVPYEIIKNDADNYGTSEYWGLADKYLNNCAKMLEDYGILASIVGKDAAGYEMPQGMRNVLVMSATPFQWKHMISQRSCNRNTLETQYVLLRCWEELFNLSPMFEDCGPACMHGPCPEGKMCCGNPMKKQCPTDILNMQFKYLRGGTKQ